MYNTKSPNKKKLKSGVQSTIGGKLGGSTYKTASPYSIKTNNMTNTNGLSPLMQAAVGGENKTVAGQYLTPGEEPDTYLDEEAKEGYTDPEGFVEIDENGFVVDLDYIIDENNIITGVKGEAGSEEEQGEGGIPEMPPGGVGGPMQMASPYKNYKNPQDYKVFNFGNKPTPFNKYKKRKY